jgi:fucose 4-O-acetylase-like acetyltransferase
MVDNITQSLLTPLQSWLIDHPIVAWMVAHPLWAIACCFVALLLCWGLLGALARLIQQGWLLLLQAPFNLLRFLFSGLFRLRILVPVAPEEAVQQKLLAALERLEILRQEEELLMQEVKTMLKNSG